MATPVKEDAAGTSMPDTGQKSQPKPRPKRRKEAPVRRVSARVADRRNPNPIIFNYGANLTRHEREKAKERLAMIAVGVVALICVLVLVWGWVDQNVIIPAQPVATVNGVDIHKAPYAHMQNWQTSQLNGQIAQYQQEITSLGSAKKNASLSQALQQQVTQMQSQLQTVSTDALTRMEEAIVLKQSASKQYGITASASDLSKELATITKQLGGASAYSSVLKSTGFSASEFNTWIVEPTVLTTKVTARVGSTVSPWGPWTVHARHILVATKDKALAQSLLKQLRNGGNWTALAKKYSIDTGSKTKGGDLGNVQQGTTVAPFDKAIFSMKPGQIELVQSTYGWHIVEVLSKKTRQKLSQSDLDTAKSNAFNTWIQTQVQSAKISPASAIPNLSPTGSGPTGSTTGQ